MTVMEIAITALGIIVVLQLAQIHRRLLAIDNTLGVLHVEFQMWRSR